jgi:hypothetical protein
MATMLWCVKSEVGLVCRATIMFNHWCNAGLPCMTSHMAGHSSSIEAQERHLKNMVC